MRHHQRPRGSASALPGLLVRAPVPHPRCRQDAASGLRDYDVQYGTWTSWLTDTARTQADFLGERDQSYYFRVQATDHVNNTSAWVEAGPVLPAGPGESATRLFPALGQAGGCTQSPFESRYLP